MKLPFGIAVATAMLAAIPAAHGQNSYMGEIQLFGSIACPANTLDANGALLPIQPNQALFGLLQTTFGGDGRVTFALPDLRGRTAVHVTALPGRLASTLGVQGGREAVRLSIAQIPSHSHTGIMFAASDGPNTDDPANGVLPTFGGNGPPYIYDNSQAPSIAMKTGTVAVDVSGGGGMPVPIAPPYLTLRSCIVTSGS